MKNSKLIFKAVALGVGVGTLVLSVIGKLSEDTAITLLSIGVACLAIIQFHNKKRVIYNRVQLKYKRLLPDYEDGPEYCIKPLLSVRLTLIPSEI